MPQTCLTLHGEISEASHFVRFYERDDILLTEVNEFLAQALHRGGTAIMIATPEHTAKLARPLRLFQENIKQFQANSEQLQANSKQHLQRNGKQHQLNRFIFLDAEETLAKFLIDGWPDRARFNAVVGPIIAEAAACGGPIHAFGEMVALLCAQQKYDAAIHLEKLWNELSSQYVFRLFCAYSTRLFASSDHMLAFQEVCCAHDHIRPSEHLDPHASTEDLQLLLATWEQKSSALEAEVVRRRDAEVALRHREAELHDFVENAAEGLHRVAGDGTILWANRAELELLGYRREDYVGHHITEFHVDRVVIDAMLETLVAGGTLCNQPARLRCADGSIKHVLINSNACFEEGKFLYTRCFTRDATDRVECQQAQDQLRDTLIHAPIAMALLIGPEHIFQIANNRYCDMVACPNLIGQRFADALPTWHKRGFDTALDNVFRTGQSFSIDEFSIELGTASELEERVFNISLEPLRGTDGSIAGIIASSVDLTQQVRDRKKLQHALHERSELLVQLRETSRAKDEFLAMLGHELRNPLAPIVTALQLMRMRGDTGTAHEQAIIQRQVDHLVQLISDLLDISKVTRGLIDLRKEWISVADVLTKAVEMVSPLFEQRSHRLSVDAAEQLYINGDAVRLAQVVSNLLSNAARYTPIGGEIHLTARRDSWEHIVITVRDNGIGISAEMVPQIFDLFFQGARDGGRSEGGLGIGLALVKSFVELHGGSASVRSDGKGCGSEFAVRLPVATEAPQAITQLETPARVAAHDASATLKILIVDDNVDAAETLALFLTTAGHEVQVVASPTSLLLQPRTFLADLAVLDIGLPVMDGYELAAQLQRNSEWNNCEFVALTGYGQDVDRARSKNAGFKEHFVKPIDPHALLRFIGEIVAVKQATAY